nr:MAG: ORF1 [TTV-like mini virus]UGV42571.1 MAG: ORF1 [TTV-like mini virus]
MPPFRRNWWSNYYKPKWRRRRFPARRRRFTTTFRKRRRRTKKVKRHFYSKKYKRKLKKIILRQWQPSTIKRCKIEGYLCLFQAGKGRFSFNYASYKESFCPEHEPGGGGWGLQQLSLSNLYSQNCDLMNWWTKSNNHLNLCRYMGCEITLFRQDTVDYVFTYFDEQPKNVSKYYYATFHPTKLMLYNRKIVVPSFASQPHKRKPYKRKFIRAPKLMKNQWYFQQQLAPYPLLQFAATAVSLNKMFGSSKALNNNCTVYCLNTDFFRHPHFQYSAQPFTPDGGNQPTYIYTIQRGEPPITAYKYFNLTFLGQTMTNDPGIPLSNNNNYTKNEWGNVFFYKYLNNDELTYVSKETIDQVKQKKDQQITSGFTLKDQPYYYTLKYNPYKDKGKGNQAYWVSNIEATKQNWEPPNDPDLIISDFPFWIMLWGWEDMTKRIGKCRNLDNDWILVLRTQYFSDKMTAYVPLSEAFIHGQGPYFVDRSEIKGQDYAHWYPRYRYQREAIENILMTGPMVCRADNINNIQSLIKYKFFFKWGGTPATMENVYDPMSQPITPSPNNLISTNEIINPETSIDNYIYKWDTRRDILTQKATDRITKSSTYDSNVFTDGRETSTDIPLFQATQKAPQEETPETQAETLLLQLHQLQQFNLQLQQRFNNLKQLMQNI